MLDSVVEVLTTSHQWSPGSIPGWGKIFSMDCSGYNSGVLREHSSIRFSWVTACGWSETILHDTAFITMWVSFKKWGWPGWLLSAKMEGVGWRGGEWGEIFGWSWRCSPIWSKKQVERAGTVVQGYVGGLLGLGGEPGLYFVKRDLGVGS